MENIKEAMRKVTDAGGQVLGEPMEIPGVGRYVSFTDTEGNRVRMLQPIPRNGHAPKPEPTTAREAIMIRVSAFRWVPRLPEVWYAICACAGRSRRRDFRTRSG